MNPKEFLDVWWAKHGDEIFQFMVGKVNAANERAEAAEAELAALRERERWIPVEEKLPEKSDEYQVMEHNGTLASVADFNFDDQAWYTLRGFGYDSEVRELHNVTHWKALSAAPERGKEAKS